MAKPCPECHADYIGKCPYCGTKLPGLPDWEEDEMRFLKLREDRPATIEEHRALRAEIERLQAAKRAALAIADERTKENVELRAALQTERERCAALVEGQAEFVAGDACEKLCRTLASVIRNGHQ